MRVRNANPVAAVILLWVVMAILGAYGIHWQYYINHPWMVALGVAALAFFL